MSSPSILHRFGPESREVRGYTLLRNIRDRDAVSVLWAGFSHPAAHDERRSCPSTLTNPMRFGCPPGICLPGPALNGALLPRDPQRQDFRVPTPTRSASSLHQEQVYDPCTSAMAFAPRHPRRRASPLDPDQPCARWMRARPLPPWTGPRRTIAALTRPSATVAAIPETPASELTTGTRVTWFTTNSARPGALSLARASSMSRGEAAA